MNKHLSPATFRFIVQLGFTLFYIYVGVQFVAFLDWATGASQVFVPRPAAVEGFLPISALLAVRQWLATGQWDSMHPAGLTIFFAIVVMAFVFRKGFCGYICPVGFISNLLERAGRKIKLAIIPIKWVDYPLMSIKYIGTGFFIFTVFISMDLRSVQSFLTAPYNMVADAKMLAFFTDPSTTSLMVIGGLIVLSLVVRNAWCRYLCPYGALLGLIAWFSPVAVRRDASSCISCSQCTQGCPAGIKVEEKHVVRSTECIGCAECIGHCPVDGCLDFHAANRVRLPWFAVGVGAVVILLGFWVWAVATGHWESGMPPSMLKRMYTTFLDIV